ncbi:MAG: beta-glucosidase H [Acidimicrobiales bacterium]
MNDAGTAVSRGHRTTALAVLTAITLILSTLVAAAPASGAGRAESIASFRSPANASRCPWVGASRHHRASPEALARDVLAKMTNREKVNFVILRNGHGVENFNSGVASLCIPPLTLSDGPDGLAGRVTGATQLPAAIGVGASFDTSLARQIGQVLGAEARTKGIDVVQGPDMNLARVPQSGRIFETLGEDPMLTGTLAAASIEGIQSEGVMAMAKHLSAYTQETARARLNQIVTSRALAELYDEPFRTAVLTAHVASIMCASGLINGVHACADPYLYSVLAKWGFKGFVRSDMRAAPNALAALNTGLDLIKPGRTQELLGLVNQKRLSERTLNHAVLRILNEMFAYGLIAHPRYEAPFANAATPAHAAIALKAAEESAVLLKNTMSTLPLATNTSSVAVIGPDASTAPITTGDGSSQVIAPFVITPLSALEHSLAKGTRVTYTPGGPATYEVGRQLGVHFIHGSALPLELASTAQGTPGNADLYIDSAANVTNAVLTASKPGTAKGWSHWHATFRVRHPGEYQIALHEIGDTWLKLNGKTVLASPGLHTPTIESTVVQLAAKRRYSIDVRWFTVIHDAPPELGIVDVTPAIRAAVAAAKKASVAIVFAGAQDSEGADQNSLSLPGDENALISAVSAVNHHTVVVLNTGGAVLMPWLHSVASVIEDWYPGEEDGTAIANVLTGRIDPSGRLPLTFPTSLSAQPITTSRQFPGVNGTVSFGSGSTALDIGYRWYQANGVAPLFPFGYGLSYTSFHLSNATMTKNSSSIHVALTVTNTGDRLGTDVVQAYVKFPNSTGEPPEQLKAFSRVTLQPFSSSRISMTIPLSSLQVYLNGKFRTVSGQYVIGVGQSSNDLTLHFDASVA